MKQHGFALIPRDLLFLRDARPMSGASAGQGARFPRPDQFAYALLNGFHRVWGEYQPWEGGGRSGRETCRGYSDRFPMLKTAGPFPMKNGELYFPCPQDWDMEIVPLAGTNLPSPLTCGFRDRRIGKKSRPEYVSRMVFESYLTGKTEEEPPAEPLFKVERNVGIGIDREKGTAGNSQFYQAEYLRLIPGVSLYAEAECILPNGADVLEKWACQDLIMGGQQGIVHMLDVHAEWLSSPAITTRYLRWTLLTPVLFRHGWMPDWCVDSRKLPEEKKAALGTVMLKECDFARLIAARIGKPLAFSGWDLQTGAKPTQLAVPAGSCYVFDCGTPEQAALLAEQLSFPRRRSSVWGDKGYGIGICSSVNIKNQL